MKTLLLSLLLAASAFNVQAQPVTASTDLLELPPALPFETSPWATVVFTNQTDNAIDVYGLGSNGPFGFDWECSGGGNVELPPRGTCVLSVRFEGGEGQPLGVIDGLVGFRLSTGTVLVDLRAFTYAPMAPFGVRNLRSSLIPLGFDLELVQTLDARLSAVETLLADASAANDRRACGQLQFFEQRVLQEAAHDRVRDWSAAVLVVQKDAMWLNLHCGGPWRNQ